MAKAKILKFKPRQKTAPKVKPVAVDPEAQNLMRAVRDMFTQEDIDAIEAELNAYED